MLRRRSRFWSRGMTLIETIISLMVLAILLTGAFQLSSVHSAAVQRTRETNLAFFVLESLRNRILTEIMRDFSFDEERARIFLKDIYVPYPIEISTVEEALKDGKHRIMLLKMTVPRLGAKPEKTFVREVLLP